MITLKEQYLYGSKRLGVRKPHLQLAAAPHTAVGFQTPNEPQAPGGWFNNDCMCYTYEEPVPVGGTPPPPPNTTFTARFYTHTLGKKEYELTNHLGNVLATVLDRKTGVKGSPTATTYAWFKADVSTAQDYYPFGSLMPGRTYVAPTGAGYRFGFNGQEKVDEINGCGNSYSAEFWQYDSRTGRRWNLDPKPTSHLSPYSVLSNCPLFFIDPLGDTIRVSDALRNNTAAYKSFEIWKNSEAGKKFYNEFDVGGKHGKVLVNFDLGNWEDGTRGETSVYARDKSNGNLRELEPQHNDEKSIPMKNSRLGNNESLYFTVMISEPFLIKSRSENDRIKNHYSVINKSLTILHETQHVKLVVSDFIKYKMYYYNSGDHHYFMKDVDGEYFKERFKFYSNLRPSYSNEKIKQAVNAFEN